MEDGFCWESGPAPNFFFLMDTQHRVVISAGEREKDRETCWSRRTKCSRKCHIAYFCTTAPYRQAATSTRERLSFARNEPGNRSPDAVKGLPSHDLNRTPLEEVSPGQSQGTLAAEGKDNFTAAAPLGWLHRGAEDFNPQWSPAHCLFLFHNSYSTFQKNLFLTEEHILNGLMCQRHIAQLSVRAQSFLERKMTGFLATCFP